MACSLHLMPCTCLPRVDHVSVQNSELVRLGKSSLEKAARGSISHALECRLPCILIVQASLPRQATNDSCASRKKRPLPLHDEFLCGMCDKKTRIFTNSQESGGVWKQGKNLETFVNSFHSNRRLFAVHTDDEQGSDANCAPSYFDHSPCSCSREPTLGREWLVCGQG